MSFIKTLVTLAVGFAAAKGYQKFRTGGGMAGLQDNLKSAGAPGGVADTIGGMAEKIGIPGATETVRNLMGQAGGMAATGAEAAQSGLGGMMSAVTGAAAAGTGAMAGIFASLTQGTAVGGMAEGQAKLMIRAMIEAAKADGAIDADEQAKIMEHVKDAEPAEIAYVKDLMAAPPDLAGLAADTDTAMRSQVFSASLMAIRVDSAAESAYLVQLAQALGIDDATFDALIAAAKGPA